MNEPTTPPAATPAATTTTPPVATAQATAPAIAPVIKTKLGIPCKILGRGQKPDEVLIERQNDGARRIYRIADLQCDGGEKAIAAELDRVSATDKQL